jgi:hypothetical protein
MFTLLLKTDRGWTDILGDGVDADANLWETEDDAWVAVQDFRDVGIGKDCANEWRVVHVDDLGNYDLIA